MEEENEEEDYMKLIASLNGIDAAPLDKEVSRFSKILTRSFSSGIFSAGVVLGLGGEVQHGWIQRGCWRGSQQRWC